MSEPPDESPPSGDEKVRGDAREEGRGEEDEVSLVREDVDKEKEEEKMVYSRSAEERMQPVGLIVSEKEGVKVEVRKSGNQGEDSVPPALPPRPPPRPRQPCTCTCALDEGDVLERNERGVPRYCWSNGLRKYVFLCTACGSLSILLGGLFLIVYFMLKSYTSSLNHFETIPTYVPSGMLIATGFLIISLACRKNRNSFLMKLCGLCSLCCAVLCVSVTVTTTVIHMNRLQTLRECLYTLKTQSCTCYSVLMDNDRISDDGIKFVFNSTPDCEVIHGALYSCLRAIFGLSVIGILVCIFSCMLVYQLLSHEKKKMYWAQLEMRCRYLYRQQRNSHYYSCCDECRYPPHPHELFPWDLMGNRFWSTGRIGNLYTPNPEDRGNANRLRSGWNWRRLPWSRAGANSSDSTRVNVGSPDSQYGFSSTPAVDGTPYTVLDPRTADGISCHPGIPPAADITEGGFYSWGPPPPYASNRNSANNSPARRSLGDVLHQVSPIRRNDNVSPARGLHHVHRHHLHHNRQCGSSSRQLPNNTQNPSDSYRTTPITNAIQQQQSALDPLWTNSLSSVQRFQKALQNKTNYENMYDPEAVLPNSGFNTLPSLKRRTQPRVSDIFRDETSTAYFFSSAENLGCSTTNIKMDATDDNLPPRVFLKSPPARHPPPNTASTTHNFSFKTPNDLPLTDSPNQQPTEGADGTDPRRNTSIMRKLLVNCSPSKQKPRQDAFPVEKTLAHTPRKKTSKKVEAKDVGMEDNVITFHYRVGIPRSPDVQNLSQFVEKSPFKGVQGGGGGEGVKDRGAESELESQKLSKNTKYISKDVDLLQKHGSLIKEFRKNLDSQRKFRESEPEKEKLAFPKSFHAELRRSPADVRQNFPDPGEDYAHQKPTENESDVYFGDISNSSCYMSLQNDGLESLVYEDAPRFSSTGHHVLNKQNLKMMENETMAYNQIVQRHDPRPDSTYSRHSHAYRHRNKLNNQFQSPEDNRPLEPPEECNPHPLPPQQDHFKKNPRRPYPHPLKYYPQGLYHQQESNDEHSSGSFTADSGISTGRGFTTACYDSTYHEIEAKVPAPAQNDDSCLASLDFSHPLFQKPKVLPRGGRYKDSDPRQNKFELEESESANDGDLDCQTKRKRAGKGAEEIPNQLLTTCSLTLSRDPHHFLDDSDLPPPTDPKPPPKSPKPLPRTTAPKNPDTPPDHYGKTSRYLQKDALAGHYIAPDAQYDFQESLQAEAKPRTPAKGKPAVPARPLSLQVEHKKTGKADNVSLRVMRAGGEGRRGQKGEEGGGKEPGEVPSHSVNV